MTDSFPDEFFSLDEVRGYLEAKHPEESRKYLNKRSRDDALLDDQTTGDESQQQHGQQPTAKRSKDLGIPDVGARPDLINAVKAADTEQTTRLLDNRHDANILYRRGGWTPLIVAAMESNYEPRMPEIVSLLIKRGANVNTANQVGCTSLAAALPYLIRAIPHSTALPLSTAREVPM